MPKTALKARMKKNELYVVYTEANRETLEERWLTYGDGTPRIYAKHTLDPRILDSTTICTTWDSALKFLWAGKGSVMVPLSLELRFKSAANIRRWAASQREVDPHEVIDYVNRISPPESPDSNSVQHAKNMVTSQQRWWISNNPSGTLAELLAVLESVRDECDHFDKWDIITDHVDDLSNEAVDYFASWSDPSEFDDEEPVTFAYRRDELDEDIEHVEELYDSIGGHVLVAELGESLSKLAVAG